MTEHTPTNLEPSPAGEIPAADTQAAPQASPPPTPVLTDEEIRERVIEAIKTVYDPEIPVDVYDLGLIYEIRVFPIQNVYLQMTLTSPSCPSAGTLPGEVESKVRAIPGVADVQVELTFDPPYTQDMMSEAARLELGFM